MNWQLSRVISGYGILFLLKDKNNTEYTHQKSLIIDFKL